MLKNKQKGFTLVELLVVIAIIGILSSIVLASLNTSRLKARDAKRIAEIAHLRLALTLYADDNNGAYPASAATFAASLAPLVTGGYISALPVAPLPGLYQYAAPVGGATYHLGALLESTTNPALSSDADCSSAAATFCRGFTVAATGGFSGADPMYDILP